MEEPDRRAAQLTAQEAERAIEAQELLRGQIPDAIIDATITSLHAALDDARSRERGAERRFVSVLFADLVGFTKFSEGRDPELVAATMNGLWASVDQEIIEHGGRIDKHMGDSVMGVWGTHESRESDAQLAVRSALGIRDRCEEFNHSWGVELGIRVGIGTGYVFVSSISSSGELSLTGDTVNTASRMESAAPTGSILVTDATRALLGDSFVTEQVDPLRVKGKSETVEAHLVHAHRPPPTSEASHDRPGGTAFVGREHEAGLMRAAFESTRRGAAVEMFVHGESGVGKTTLAAQFLDWVRRSDSPPTVLFARAAEFSRTIPLSLVRDLLWRHLGIVQDQSTESARRAVEQAFASVDPTGGAVIAKWLGLDTALTNDARFSGSELAASARVHLRRFVRDLAESTGVVIVLEDLHWGDDDSIRALRETLDLEPGGLMIVGTTRLLDDRLSPRRHTELLPVEPFDVDATAELISALLPSSHPSVATTTRIHEIAHGNPLHVEELVRSVISGGQADDNALDIDALDRLIIPISLAGAFQTRIDSLAERDRDVLQCAAVIGRRFWDRSVVSLDDRLGPNDIERSLQHLVEADLIARRDRSAFRDCVEYRFKHGLMRSAAYETVLLDRRRELHHRMVDWLDGRVDERTHEFAGELAHHLVASSDTVRASVVLSEAGQHAMTVGSYLAAHQLFKRALDIDDREEPDATRADLLLAYGWALSQSGAPADAIEVLTEARRLAGALDLSQLAWKASMRLATAMMTQGQWDAAAELIDELENSPVERSPDDVFDLHRSKAALAEAQGEPGSGLDDNMSAVETARQAGLDDELCRGLAELGWSLFRLGRSDDVRATVDEAFAIAERLGNLERQAALIMNQAVVSHLAAQDDPSHRVLAIEKYLEAIQRFTELGSLPGRLRASGNLAQVEIESGEIATGSRRARAVFVEAWRAELAIEWSLGLLVLAQAKLTSGDRDAGYSMLASLVNDPRVERWDDQISRTLEMVGVDADHAWDQINAVHAEQIKTIVTRLERETL